MTATLSGFISTNFSNTDLSSVYTSLSTSTANVNMPHDRQTTDGGIFGSNCLGNSWNGQNCACAAIASTVPAADAVIANSLRVISSTGRPFQGTYSTGYILSNANTNISTKTLALVNYSVVNCNCNCQCICVCQCDCSGA